MKLELTEEIKIAIWKIGNAAIMYQHKDIAKEEYEKISLEALSNAHAAKDDRLLAAVSSDMESERYEYKGVLLQRMTKDYVWYAIYENQIINWSQYRHDLESWIDKNHSQNHIDTH